MFYRMESMILRVVKCYCFVYLTSAVDCALKANYLSIYLTSPYLSSPQLTSPYLTSPHPTYPDLTIPHLVSSGRRGESQEGRAVLPAGGAARATPGEAAASAAEAASAASAPAAAEATAGPQKGILHQAGQEPLLLELRPQGDF